MRIVSVKMQKIYFKEIPLDFSFKDSDVIFDYLEHGYFAEYPNANLKKFMFGEVYKTLKFVSDEKS